MITSNVPEGEQIEFKESLSTEKGTVDPWMDGQDKIGNRAKEAVRFSGLPESTIRRLLRSGKLPGIKVGGWRIRRSDLEELGCRQFADLSDTLSLTSL